MAFKLVVVAFLAFRTFGFEAFIVPTNAMAPTLLGRHWQSICPQCGAPCYCTPVDDRLAPSDPPRMICCNFHVAQAPNPDRHVAAGDRFLVAKFLRPRRWDLVVFRYPENPSTLYVMRLVGLPGEKIAIQNGAVWVNGARLTVP
ncbi:signal peptidase I, partial [Candidatus Kaiserbacteria bacterium]|nr:signal peptidase I [Candidatus Kaiserbacteria bacterium]